MAQIFPPYMASAHHRGVTDVEVLRSAAYGPNLVRYVLREGPRVSRRATVWERVGGSWRVVYHLGTVG